MGAASELAFTVPLALRNPTAVFRGVTEQDGEDGDETWMIYVAVPPTAWDHRTHQERQAWKEEVFLVFVDDDGIIRRWRWKPADAKNPRLPADHDKGRFQERVL